MRVPVWLTLGVAVLVCAFGLYRMRIAFRSDEEDERARARKGLYAMGRRTHFLIGVIYLLLGGALAATSFGWNPFGSLFAPSAPTTPSPPGGTARPPAKLVPVQPPATAPTPAAPVAPGAGAAPSTGTAPSPAAGPAPTPDPAKTPEPSKPAPDRNAPPPNEER